MKPLLEVLAYYEQFAEESRLSTGPFKLGLARTKEIFERVLVPSGLVIAAAISRCASTTAAFACQAALDPAFTRRNAGLSWTIRYGSCTKWICPAPSNRLRLFNEAARVPGDERRQLSRSFESRRCGLGESGTHARVVGETTNGIRYLRLRSRDRGSSRWGFGIELMER